MIDCMDKIMDLTYDYGYELRDYHLGVDTFNELLDNKNFPFKHSFDEEIGYIKEWKDDCQKALEKLENELDILESQGE